MPIAVKARHIFFIGNIQSDLNIRQCFYVLRLVNLSAIRKSFQNVKRKCHTLDAVHKNTFAFSMDGRVSNIDRRLG